MARRTIRLIGLATLGSIALAGVRAAAAEPPILETTLSGGAPAVDAGAFQISGEVLYTPQATPVTVFHYFAVGPDCAQRPVSITVIDPPAHGRLALSEGAEPAVYAGRPLWGDSDPRVRCLDRLVPTRDGAYAPDPGSRVTTS